MTGNPKGTPGSCQTLCESTLRTGNRNLRFIIEIDGGVFGLRDVYYEVHRQVATEVGWSQLDQPTFWRMLRKQGREANVLRGARPQKLANYLTRFDQLVDADEMVARLRPHDGIEKTLADVSVRGRCFGVTIGANLHAHQSLLDELDLARLFSGVEALDRDPRRRPGQLRMLAEGDDRTIVVAASDALTRSSSGAELLTAGVTSGACSEERLHQAGASVVFSGLSELLESLRTGGQALIRAGLLPPPLGE